MSFWLKIAEFVEKNDKKNETMAKIIAEKEAKRKYSKFLSPAKSGEEIAYAMSLIKEDLYKLAKNACKKAKYSNVDAIYSSVAEALIGDREPVNTIKSYKTKDGHIICIEHGYDLGIRETKEKEAVYYVSLYDKEGNLINDFPFLSPDGNVPEDAYKMFERLKQYNLGNYTKEKDQKSDMEAEYHERSVGKPVKISQEMVKVKRSKPFDEALREYRRIRTEYEKVSAMQKDLKEKLGKIIESKELQRAFNLIEQNKKVFAEVDDLLYEFRIKSRENPSYKSIVDEIVREFPELEKRIQELKEQFTSISESKDIVIKSFSLKDLFSRIKSGLLGISKSLRKIRNLLKNEKTSGLNPHCPFCGSLQLQKSGNNFQCEICGNDFRYFRDGTYDYRVSKQAQNTFTPVDYTPEEFVPEQYGEEPKEEKKKPSVTKSFVTEEEVKRWFGGNIPRRDSVAIDVNGNRWKYIGPAGPGTHEIEKLEDEGPTPDKAIGQPSGLAPFAESPEPGEEELGEEEFGNEEFEGEEPGENALEEEREEKPGEVSEKPKRSSSSKRMEKTGKSLVVSCKNCDFYDPISKVCELIDEEVEENDKCDFFTPYAHESEFVEKYTPAPAMKDDSPVVGRRNRRRKVGQSNISDMISLYNKDREEFKSRIMEMDQDEFARFIDEVEEISGGKSVKKFLRGLWNKRYEEGEEPSGQEPFYSQDSPASYLAPRGKKDDELVTSITLPITKFCNSNRVSDRRLVKAVLEKMSEFDIKAIYRMDEEVEIII